MTDIPKLNHVLVSHTFELSTVFVKPGQYITVFLDKRGDMGDVSCQVELHVTAEGVVRVLVMDKDKDIVKTFEEVYT